jgi:lysophospholipase L1-like esterase
VSILQPSDHHLQSSNNLYVLAQIYGVNVTQTGWGVKFVLDYSDEILDYESPYEAYFQNLSKSEHVVVALLVDECGAQVSGESTYDQVNNVAVGDYYVAIGDSITDGDRDDYFSDDISDDGRIIGGGYPPILANHLVTALGYPHLIVNEGVGGDASSDGLALLPEILNRHPDAKRFLVQYGTNDSSGLLPVPSGYGLELGDDGYDGTFKDNMQQIVDLINGEGKEVCLSKVPIARGQTANSEPFPDPENASRNIIIQEYNAVIDELVQEDSNGIVVNPPDFYNYFKDHLWDEFYDNLHPNGVGYQSMADLWFYALTE